MDLTQPGPGHDQGNDYSDSESRQNSRSDVEEAAVEHAGK
ncbi:hypothetical protein E2C01_041279 [Portunus trituberculatus]|uniref:Uncharacterized protein n=1 Tax=Portunus trituberculatus TaxID=210409 RepID=A0A5B7FJM1_PORTR|nr:hypothetical protein [Portunus trituberculatus]